MALALGEPITMGPPVRNTPRDMSLVVSALPQVGQGGAIPSNTISSNSFSQELQTYSKIGIISPCQGDTKSHILRNWFKFGHCFKKIVIHEPAQHVTDGRMDFLDKRRTTVRHNQGVLAVRDHGATVSSA